MKSVLIAAALLAATLATTALAADVGVSISVGQPGFYGRLDLGDLPPPQVIHPRPIIIERGVPMDRPPIYLRVPHNHRKNWKRYCHRYNACGEQVIFVRDDWYNHEYVPRYQERRHERREERREERRDERRSDDRGGDNNYHHGREHGRNR